ncbi:hypothetical protein ACIA8K_12630 [Catenuloplanes sp. NPDC051500]|uniref:hypothetical protein n=1 Tax=Catenuloplanes sp. NPDC051500 TaxID=3363959 RepID=UPI00378814DA
MADAVIGSIAVKITPDTTDFKKEAKVQLERIEKSLDPIKVKVELDTTGLKAAAERVQRQLEAALKDAKVRVDLEGQDRLHVALAAIQRQIDSLSGSKVKLDVDKDHFDAQLAWIQEDVDAIDLDVDLDEVSRRHVLDQISDIQDHLDELRGDIEVDVNEPAKIVAQVKLAALTRPRTVTIIPQVSKSAVTKVATLLAALSGARLLGDILDKLWNSIKNLDKAIPLIGTLALAIANLGSVGIASAANLFALASSLASIGPAALALPGILGGVAIGLTATVVAFADFKQRIPEVVTAWNSLKSTIQDNFWAVAQEPLRELIDGLLPEFSSGMAKVSTQLGGFFASLATGLGDSLVPALAGMFDDLSESITIATGATGDMASIIAILGTVGAGYLPRLAQWFADITARLNEFLIRASEGGEQSQLNGWINTGIEALKDLGTILVESVQILNGFAKAAEAAGGSSLATLADALTHISDVVNGANFQSKLTNVFVAAHAAMDEISTRSGPGVEKFFSTLADTLQAVLPLAGQALGDLLGGLTTALSQASTQMGIIELFDGIAKAVTALQPALGPVATALGALLGLIGAMAAAFAPVIATIFTALAGAVIQLAPVIEQLVMLLSGVLLAAVTALAPVVGELATAFAGLGSGGILDTIVVAFSGLAPVLQTIAPLLGDALVAALGALMGLLGPVATLLGSVANVLLSMVAEILPLIVPLWDSLGSALAGIVTALTPVITKILEIATAIIGPLVAAIAPVVTEWFPKMKEAIARLAEALMPVLVALQAVVDFLVPILAPAIAFVAGLLLDTFVGAINGVALVFEGVVEIVTGIWNTFAGLFTGDWSRMWDGIKSIFKGIWDTIVGIIETALNVFVIGKITGFFKAGAKLFAEGWASIRSGATAAWDGIKGGWSSFLSTLSNLGSSAMSTLRSIWSGGLNALKGVAESAWNAVRGAFSSGVSAVVNTVRNLPSTIRDALSNAGSVLVSVGRQIIEGLISGIKSMFSTVAATLGALTDMLPDWKGPAQRDRVLLYDAGQLVIDGFINGLESRYGAVRESLTGLTDEVSGMQVEAPGVSRSLTAAIDSAIEAGGGSSGGKTLNYYAAPGSSISSEEDLFKAADRARMVGW